MILANALKEEIISVAEDLVLAMLEEKDSLPNQDEVPKTASCASNLLSKLKEYDKLCTKMTKAYGQRSDK